MTVTGGTFDDNKALEHGGALVAWGYPTVVIITSGLFKKTPASRFCPDTTACLINVLSVRQLVSCWLLGWSTALQGGERESAAQTLPLDLLMMIEAGPSECCRRQ